MNKKLTKVLFAAMATLCIGVPAAAQWEYGGKPLAPPNGYSTWDVCSDSAGGAIVTWDLYYEGSWEIFAQRVDSAGYRLWGGEWTEFVMITDTVDTQQDPRIVADGVGGAYIVWADFRHSAQGASMFAQHIDSEGNILWERNGIKLINPNWDDWIDDLLLDNEGGLIAACHDARNGLSDVYAQRVSTVGQLLWDTAGVSLGSAYFLQIDTKFGKDTLDNYYAVWVDGRNFETNGYDIYAQKFDINGQLFWGDSGSAVVNAPEGQGAVGDFNISPDNMGGLVVIWNDNRYHYPYDGMKANRLSSSGASLWSIYGIEVLVGLEPIYNKPVIFNLNNDFPGYGPFFIPQGFTHNNETWGFCLDYDGNQTCGPGGYLLFSESTDEIIYAGGGIFYAMVDIDRIKRAVKFDIFGNFLWPNYPVISDHGPHFKLIPDLAGGMLCTWKHVDELRIQRVYSNGHVGGDPDAAEDDQTPLPENIGIRSYPNPTNSQVMINFYLPQSEDIEIAIYDLLGRRQEILYEGGAHQGNNSIAYKFPEVLSSGLYFIRLQSDHQSATTTITLLK